MIADITKRVCFRPTGNDVTIDLIGYIKNKLQIRWSGHWLKVYTGLQRLRAGKPFQCFSGEGR